jgi:TatD DNase family protein
VDIGANLTHESFRQDLPEVLARARAAGVTRLVVTGTTVEHSAAAATLAADHPGVLWATAGIHPHHAAEWTADTAGRLREILALPGVVAAGECGLDYFRDFSPRPDQRRAFEAQLRLAAETGRPVFLHQREAHDMLREFRPDLSGGVAHCFTDGPAEIEDYLALGLHIGITGWICDERRGGALREAVKRLPLDRLLVETDCPYLLPRTLRPAPATRRNEPAFLPAVVETLAACMGQPPETVAAASTANAVRFFGLGESGQAG